MPLPLLWSSRTSEPANAALYELIALSTVARCKTGQLKSLNSIGRNQNASEAGAGWRGQNAVQTLT